MFEQLAIYREMTPLEMGVLLFPVGAAIGSFSTMLLHRIPRGESLIRPRSHCPACRHTLGPGELIPVVSFVWQRGRCRNCRTHIPWRYPMTELGSGALASLVGVAGGWAAGFLALGFWTAASWLLAHGMRRQAQSQSGMTLVEVLIALGLLVGMAIPMYQAFGNYTRDSKGMGQRPYIRGSLCRGDDRE